MRPSRVCARSLGVLLLVIALGGCPGSERDPPPDAVTTAEHVLEKARTYLGGGPAHAVLEARASQYSDEGGIKGKVDILLARPGKLRFTALSPTDDVVSVLATDGERFVAFERGKKSCYVGRACPANVGRFTGFPLATDDLVGVLIGRPPIVPHERADFTWDKKMGAYRLDLVGTAAQLGGTKGETQRLWVRHEDGRVIRMQMKSGDKTEVDVRYSDWRTVKGHALPGRIDVKMARGNVDLRVDFRDIDLESPIEDKAFVFECPTGTVMEEQPCY